MPSRPSHSEAKGSELRSQLPFHCIGKGYVKKLVRRIVPAEISKVAAEKCEVNRDTG
jgi:hypothetical protein